MAGDVSAPATAPRPTFGHDGMVTQAQETTAVTTSRARMTGKQRREQLLEVGRKLFADKGFEATTVEEIAAKAGVSKPVVYEHFGGKEGLYAVVVDREIRSLLDGMTGALSTDGHARVLLEQAALALLDYVENSTDGFRILVRDSPAGQSTGSFASLLSDVASQVEHILAAEFKHQKLDPKTAPIYAQMLVGMVALTGQWWMDSRKFKKADVAAHLVNLAWNGLGGMEPHPAHHAQIAPSGWQPLQKPADRGDTDLVELPVVLSDAAEPHWCPQADDLIEAGPQTFKHAPSCHRGGKDDRAGPATAQHAGRGSGGRTSGHAIVDDDGHPSFHIKNIGGRSQLSHNVLNLLRSFANQGIQLLGPHPTG